MNRFERRRRAKELQKKRAFEQEYAKVIEERQNKVDDETVLYFLCSVALALNKVYGWKRTGIRRILEETSYQMTRVMNEELTVEQMQKELLDKTNFEIVWRES